MLLSLSNCYVERTLLLVNLQLMKLRLKLGVARSSLDVGEWLLSLVFWVDMVVFLPSIWQPCAKRIWLS